MCPLTNQPCSKDECLWWIVLTAGNEEHGRCTAAWLPILLVELKGVIAKCIAKDDKETQ